MFHPVRPEWIEHQKKIIIIINRPQYTFMGLFEYSVLTQQLQVHKRL